jgi:F0F1-type ATP synthase membrane subunit c/vacuolar-type H+-ATPase subunit K
MMDRNFWRDLYPVSETRRRFAHSSYLWIYLPVAAAGLITAGIAAAVLGSVTGEGIARDAQLATVAMAMALLAAGFIAWLVILALLWGLGDILGVLPVISGRVRLRFVTRARSLRRTIYGVKRTAAAVYRFFSFGRENESVWERRLPPSPRKGSGDG